MFARNLFNYFNLNIGEHTSTFLKNVQGWRTIKIFIFIINKNNNEKQHVDLISWVTHIVSIIWEMGLQNSNCMNVDTYCQCWDTCHILRFRLRSTPRARACWPRARTRPRDCGIPRTASVSRSWRDTRTRSSAVPSTTRATPSSQVTDWNFS